MSTLSDDIPHAPRPLSARSVGNMSGKEHNKWKYLTLAGATDSWTVVSLLSKIGTCFFLLWSLFTSVHAGTGANFI